MLALPVVVDRRQGLCTVGTRSHDTTVLRNGYPASRAEAARARRRSRNRYGTNGGCVHVVPACRTFPTIRSRSRTATHSRSDHGGLPERLAQLDYDVEATGTYDQQTLTAVRDFQGSQGLAPNGVVGPTTEAVLANPQPVEDPNPVLPGDGSIASPTPPNASGGKVIYLTFDDGPAVTYTEQILAHPELTRAVVDAGHALANHTWDHQDMTTLSGTGLANEITQSTVTLEKISGGDITCMRPPYGAVNDTVRAAAHDEGQALHLWDIDPQDWSRPGTEAIASNVLSNAHPGAVNLMHDGGGDRSESVEALARILPALAEQGATASRRFQAADPRHSWRRTW